MAKAESLSRSHSAPAFALALLSLLAGACRTTGPVEKGAGGAAAVQVLLRVEAVLDGERESFRAVVRRWSGGELELRVNDPLGRAVWRVEMVGEEGRWTGRDGAVCRIGGRLAAPFFGVGWPLSADELGRWLLGEAPLAGVEPGVEASVSEDSRRWTFDWLGESLAGWTLVDVEGSRLVATRSDGRSSLRFARARLDLSWSESRRELLARTAPPTLREIDRLAECRDATIP